MRVLVLRLSALGDVIHTIPAVLALRGAADVSWVVEAAYAEMVEVVAGVKTIPVRMKHWRRSLFASRGEMGRARRAMKNFDLAVDFQGLMKSAILSRLSGAPLRFGFDRRAVREIGARWFINRPVPVDRTRHVVEWNVQLAEAVLSRSRERHAAPPVAPAPANWDAFCADPGNRLGRLGGRIVLLPGAGQPEKQWPIERWREVAARYGHRALTVWGPGERELAERVGGEIAPATSLRELAALLRSSRLAVAGDTGPLHLAAALGTPVVGLYGPTDPRRNGPYGQIASSVSHFHTTRSIQSIPTAEVVAKMEEVLA